MIKLFIDDLTHRVIWMNGDDSGGTTACGRRFQFVGRGAGPGQTFYALHFAEPAPDVGVTCVLCAGHR